MSHEATSFVPCVIDGKNSWVAARSDYFLGRSGSYKARGLVPVYARAIKALSAMPGAHPRQK